MQSDTKTDCCFAWNNVTIWHLIKKKTRKEYTDLKQRQKKMFKT